jgi:uncharacterized membrane protein YkvA (DUF1232 family)/DNA-directed RNA polymerase subunit RPC12/RpoP
MSDKNYICVNCKNIFELSTNSNRYHCPLCDSFLVDKETYERFEDIFKQQVKPPTEEEIRKILGKKESLLDLIKRTPILKDCYKYIEAMLILLADPTAAPIQKGVVVVAIAYVLSPIDIIPDFIPVIGYLDDSAIILIAVAILGVSLSVIIKEQEEDSHNENYVPKLTTLINNVPNMSLYEDKNVRLWALSRDRMNTYNLRFADNKLMPMDKLYLRHPYLLDIFVPADNFTDWLENSILNECTLLLASFGAKKIDISITRVDTSDFHTHLDMDIAKKIIDGQLAADKKKYFSSYKHINQEYGLTDSYNFQVIDSLIWSFTNDSLLEDILTNRILVEQMSHSFSYYSKSGDFLNVNAKLSIEKFSSKIGFNVKLDKNSLTKLEFSVDFYPIPDDIKSNRDVEYQKALERMTIRKKTIF